MTKAKNKNNRIIYIGAAILIIAGILLFNLLNKTNTNLFNDSYPNNQSDKEYASKSLKFTIDYSYDYSIDEDQTFVNLLSRNKKINISRISTNYSTLEGYLEDFDKKRKITIENQENVIINGYNTISRIEIFNGGPILQQQVYFIYVDNWVYAFSTSSPELYSDLDQIARSFRYSP